MDYEDSIRIPAAPERLYRTIADVGNLTRFIPPIKAARRTDAEHVDVEAEYEGHEQHGEAWFRADEDAKRVEWGSEGQPYTGWMKVEAEGEGSKLTFHLTTMHAANVQKYVNETFESIRRMF
jgi:ribosome-associated toxin RatA of RatAB toxin-antitoxin module